MVAGFHSHEIIDFNKNDLKNINPKSMDSKITHKLYFAGEFLNLDGSAGDYNLKISF